MNDKKVIYDAIHKKYKDLVNSLTRKEDKSNKVTTLTNSDTEYASSKAVKDAIVQADWNETNSSSLSYIKHKPNICFNAMSEDYSELTAERRQQVSNSIYLNDFSWGTLFRGSASDLNLQYRQDETLGEALIRLSGYDQETVIYDLFYCGFTTLPNGNMFPVLITAVLGSEDSQGNRKYKLVSLEI